MTVFAGATRVAGAASSATLSPGNATPAASGRNTKDDLLELTVVQLRALCAERGVEAPSRATKAQLVALLED